MIDFWPFSSNHAKISPLFLPWKIYPGNFPLWWKFFLWKIYSPLLHRKLYPENFRTFPNTKDKTFSYPTIFGHVKWAQELLGSIWMSPFRIEPSILRQGSLVRCYHPWKRQYKKNEIHIFLIFLQSKINKKNCEIWHFRR